MEYEEPMCCCLTRCDIRSSVITEDDARVEVKSFIPDRFDLLRKEFVVAWESTGEAMFHNQCWHQLLQWKMSDLELQMLMEAKKTAEYHDGVAPTKAKAARIAEMIKKAKNCIVFTGAGISTSAGIGDFRGKSGKWTEKDRKEHYGAAARKDKKQRRQFTYESLRPTYTHEAIALLVEMGYVKDVISQNCDGLHSLSGIPMEKLWELHGNVYHERCELCNTRYQRNHTVGATHLVGAAMIQCPNCRLYHRTGRKCEKPDHPSMVEMGTKMLKNDYGLERIKQGCNGYLMETVINFGDPLESHVLHGAAACAKKNDLVLCLGTTLRVSPANSLVEMGVQPPRLVICNRQPTPCDFMCRTKDAEGKHVGVRVFGDCDLLICDVMDHILGTEGRIQWEGQREARMLNYDKNRTAHL